MDKNQVLKLESPIHDYPDFSLSGHGAIGVGHMHDAPGREKPRFPVSGFGSALSAYWEAMNAIHDGMPIDFVVTGGTHGGDVFAASWALLNNVKLMIVRPYGDPDHKNARIPEGQGFLTTFYRAFEVMFVRNVRLGRVDVLYPTIRPELYEKLSADQQEYLNLHNGIPSQEIAEAAGSLAGDQYQCYVETNGQMIAISHAGSSSSMIALSDGSGDSPGGTVHAVRTARALGTRPVIITSGLAGENVHTPADLQNLVWNPTV